MTKTARPFDPGASVIVPRRWADAEPMTKLWFYTQAIRELGNPFLFTLCFTRPTAAMAEAADATPTRYFAKRFRTYLRGVPHFFVLERHKKGALHLHGALATEGMNEVEAAARLKKVAGDRRKVKNHGGQCFFYDHIAVHVRLPDWQKSWDQRHGPFGWTSYSAKSISRTERDLGSSAVSRSESVGRKAREIFDEVVTL